MARKDDLPAGLIFLIAIVGVIIFVIKAIVEGIIYIVEGIIDFFSEYWMQILIV